MCAGVAPTWLTSAGAGGAWWCGGCTPTTTTFCAGAAPLAGPLVTTTDYANTCTYVTTPDICNCPTTNTYLQYSAGRYTLPVTNLTITFGTIICITVLLLCQIVKGNNQNKYKIRIFCKYFLFKKKRKRDSYFFF